MSETTPMGRSVGGVGGRKRRAVAWAMAAVAMVWLVTPAAGAEAPPKKLSQVTAVLPDPLRLRAVVEDGSGEDSDFTVLKANAAGTVEVLRLSSDGTGGLVLSPQQVVIEPASLKQGSQRVTFTLRDLDRPGRFVGDVVLAVAGSVEPVGKVGLDLTVHAKPTVAPNRSEATTLSLVRCNPLTCWLAAWLVPDGDLDELETRVDNLSPASVEVAARAWLLRTPGDREEVLVSPQSTRIAARLPEAAAGSSNVVTLAIDDDLAPGTYEGQVVWTASEAAPPEGGTAQRSSASRKLTLHVRAGPLVPIVLLLLGIVAGRAVRRLDTPAAKLKLKLYPRLRALEDDAEALTDADAGRRIGTKLADLRRRISRATGAEAAFNTELEAVGAQIDTLLKVERLETAVGHSDDLRNKLDAARRRILDGAPAEAASLIGEVREALHSSPSLAARSDVGDLTAMTATMTTTLRKQPAPPSESAHPRLKSVFASTLSVLSGTGDAHSLEALYWLWRPLLFVLLVVALVVQGLLLFYTGDGNQTFGSAGLADYAPLLLWGLGTDVATRTLQQISLPDRS